LLDSTATGGKLLTTPADGQRSAGWDADVDWFAWWEGTFLYGDGGSLDLGVVRDSGLKAQNKLQTFFESWEFLARIGGYKPVRVTSSLCAGGLSQVAKDVATCSPQGS
jgi:hypothetical protein